MKSILLLASLAATLAASAASTPNANDPAAAELARTGALQVKLVSRPHHEGYVERKSTRATVENVLGRPSEVLSDGSYLYRRYQALHSDALGTLVVRFEENRVCSLVLRSDEPTRTAAK